MRRRCRILIHRTYLAGYAKFATWVRESSFIDFWSQPRGALAAARSAGEQGLGEPRRAFAAIALCV
jgi:hypothetical protein